MEIDAFSGLKVADFTWILQGPLVTKCLADFGATVVNIESADHPSTIRVASPFKNRSPGINRSGLFAALNPNKYSLGLNLGHPKGRDIARKLVAWADVVAENFTPGTMEKMGLGYDDLKKIKPDIIMLRSSNQGQDGPRSKLGSLGYHLSALTGILSLVGWPDRAPVALPMAYTDYVTPALAIAALVAALDYRRRTGKGTCLDFSQLESAFLFTAPVSLDFIVNGREQTRMGNRCDYAAPHQAYRCRGEDRYCVIAVFDDQEWQSVCKVMGNPGWTKNHKFDTLLDRKRNEDELDKLVEAWTLNFTSEQVMAMMQAAGVPAAVVANCRDVFENPQIKQRHYFWMSEHPEVGSVACHGQPFQLSETPAKLRRPTPCLGQHTAWVMKEILNTPDDEFVELMNEGVLE